MAMIRGIGRWGGLAVAMLLALLAVTAAFSLGAEPAWAQGPETSAPLTGDGAAATETTDAAAAEEEEPPAVIPSEAAAPDKGDVTWMMISTILVLLMIIPGLALFYGGLVRTKNMLSVLMGVSTVTVIGMIAWALYGYSLAFTSGGDYDSFVGGFDRLFLTEPAKDGVPASDLSDNMVATFSTGVYLPELVFVLFQMTFACITAALVLGGVAERMKFLGVVIFAVLWPLLSYYPMAHMVWWWPGPDSVASAFAAGATTENPGYTTGLIYGFGALDFAGGTVVHINAGIAALVGALVLGPRLGYRNEPMPPHSLTMTYIGAALLWVGWFGFNAGSNLESNYYAVLAMANTFLATAAAGFSWILVEWVTRGKPSMLGLASGIVAGLVAVTPAAGFAGPVGAIILGLIVSPICILFCSAIKSALKYDDSLDAFGIHAIGGIVGAIGTGLVVNPAWGGAGIVDYTACFVADTTDILVTCPAATYDAVTQLTAQAKGVLVTIAWSGVASLIVFGLIRLIGALRVGKETELEGLDISEHGERAYHA